MNYVFVVEYRTNELPYISHQFSDKEVAIDAAKIFTKHPKVKRVSLATYDRLGFNLITLNPEVLYKA